MDFNHYFTNQELDELVNQWSKDYANLLELRSIGKSYEERPIWLLILTNKKSGGDLQKPAVWIDANIHATEIAGTTTALSVAYTLLDGYGSDERLRRILDTSVYYIVPRLNPDGAALAMAPNPRYIRSGVRAYPWEDKQEGLHQQDVDGDGRILQMRIQDSNGDWKVSSLDPRLMEKRSPAEYGGTYYRILPEGLVEDYDGYLIKMALPQQGLDFNRNFPFDWRAEGEQNGSGPYPASEPEIHAMVDFISKHPNINLAVAYHTYSRVILRPYSTKPDDDMEANDLWVFKKIGEIGTQITGYRNASTFHDFKYHPKEVITGAFDDWIYDHLGAFSFTIEQWDLPTEAGIKDRKFIEWYRQHPHEEDLKIIQWIDKNAGLDAYVEWYPFEHPQLGSVELGGWNFMYTWRNPPLNWMGAEAARNTPFALTLGDLLPHLSIHTLQAEPLGNDDYHLNLVVENSGFLPTFTSVQGKNRKAIRPVRAEIELPEGVSLVNGKRRIELGHLEGRSNKLDVTTNWGASPTDNRARAEWVVRAPAGARLVVKILSERAGSFVKEVILK